MKNLQKHMLAITKKVTEARKVLQGVEFNSETNKLTCTDSHRLLSISHNQEIKNDMILNLETMEQIDGNYPRTTNLIPVTGNHATINLKDIDSAIIKKLTSHKKDIVVLNIHDSVIDLEIQNDMKSSIGRIKLTDCDIKDDVMYLSGEYLRDCFKFILDFKKESKNSVITITYNGNLKPLLFSDDDDYFKYLITPIRMNQ